MTVRVLVVEDSETVRARLCSVLSAAPGIEVIGTAGDGREAVALCDRLRPDIVTMDIILPVMNGLAATRHIMAHCPTPILIVSASVNRGELFKTYEALAAGAVDVMEKPRGDDSDDDWEQRFIATVTLVSRIRVVTHVHSGLHQRPAAGEALAPSPPIGGGRYAAVAIGASTGGPGAIVDILRALPPAFTLPLIVVLHLNLSFGAAFAEWLDGQTSRPVSYAVDGEPMSDVTGRVVLAPPDEHLQIRDGIMRLSHGPERHSCRPSIDVLFESVADEYGPNAAACLLTGMGRDGATGLAAIRRQGGLTIAQDEASSVVYGMPREAALIGAVQHVLPLDRIGPALSTLVAVQESSLRS